MTEKTKFFSVDDLKYLKANIKKSNKELMEYFNCTREELSGALKRMFKNENRALRMNRYERNE
jgi:hypothetical protein